MKELPRSHAGRVTRAIACAIAGIGILVTACGGSEDTNTPTATGTPTAWWTETATPSGTETPAPTSTVEPTPRTFTGSLSVEPVSGAVGTVVHIKARDLVARAYIIFSCSSGVVQVALVDEPSAQLSWAIPKELEPRQGVGGGPTKPGMCAFKMTPPNTDVPFEVTP